MGEGRRRRRASSTCPRRRAPPGSTSSPRTRSSRPRSTSSVVKRRLEELRSAAGRGRRAREDRDRESRGQVTLTARADRAAAGRAPPYDAPHGPPLRDGWRSSRPGPSGSPAPRTPPSSSWPPRCSRRVVRCCATFLGSWTASRWARSSSTSGPRCHVGGRGRRRRRDRTCPRSKRRTSSFGGCAPRSPSSARCWRGPARPASRCRAATTSARVRSISISTDSGGWAPTSSPSTASSSRGPTA